MVNVAREPLRGDVELDETWIGGAQPGLRGSRQLKGRKAALVLVAVEKRGDISGRVRMAVIQDFRASTFKAFLSTHVAPGATLYTDGLTSFGAAAIEGYRHVPQTQPIRTALRRGVASVVPLADRAIGNLQQWLIGTHHGVSRAQLQVYLDEFVFRHNRRRSPMAAFQTLLGLGCRSIPNVRSPPFGWPGSSHRRRLLIATSWGLLKQPDKQEPSRGEGPRLRHRAVPVTHSPCSSSRPLLRRRSSYTP